ncbi:MAG: zinc dependent phospholipase C family protein [Deltaproteobacteria bacterium]|nr:zinc dependent phospholipase C family protein [Deltaproteobacteria bacterium]
MPKEITHWLIARRLAEKLDGTGYTPSLRQNPNCLMLGAVFHDALFYLPPYAAIADHWHGIDGEDTFEMIRRLSTSIDEPSSQGPMRAFLVGVISHIFADITFHPMIFHLTGQYHDADRRMRSQAVQAHRVFETRLDLLYCGGLKPIKSFSLGDYITGAELPFKSLIRKVCRELAPDVLVSAVYSAYQVFRLAQFIAQREYLASWLHQVRAGLPDPAREIASLMYAPQLASPVNQLPGELAYRHPVTGQDAVGHLDAMLDQAATRAAAFCREIESAVVSGYSLELTEPGPSMLTGLPRQKVSEMKYFAHGEYSVF